MPESPTASTYISLHAHIVFATKNRCPIIDKSGIARTHGGTAVMVGGVEDHVHMLLGYKATHCLADLVREIKKGSSAWASNKVAGFAWQTGYAGISISPSGLAGVTSYIANQEDHHKSVSSADELRLILAECGIPNDERFFE